MEYSLVGTDLTITKDGVDYVCALPVPDVILELFNTNEVKALEIMANLMGVPN